MSRVALLAVALAALAASAAAWFHEGTEHNKFIATYSILPDLFHKRSFFNLPRTLKEAERNHWVLNYARPQDKTTVYCLGDDWRVCVLYDQQGSVAGIRAAFSVQELNAAGFDLRHVPEWEEVFDPIRQDVVYAATTFFQSKEELLAGGRKLEKHTLTAPNGIYLLQTDINGTETNRLHVSNEQSQAESVGFTEQNCFFGMGKHYFQEMRVEETCENYRPYFLLYGTKTNKNKLNGFGYAQYGKVTTEGRAWFESPPAAIAKKIAPNSPTCLEDWVRTKGLITFHVYFVSNPYFTSC